MKALLFKSLTVVLLVFFIGNYLIYLKTGQMPLHDMRERMGSDWRVDLVELVSPEQLAADAKQAIKRVTDSVAEPESAAPAQVYKWTDASGQVHFSDKPIAPDAEQIAVDMRNAISAPDALPRVAEPAAAPNSSSQESALDKARAAAEAMRQRAQQQEQTY